MVDRSLLCFLFLLILGMGPMGAALGQGPAGRVLLHGQQTVSAAEARRVGRVAASQMIPVTLALAGRDPAGLEALLRRLYDPQDPLYGHYLTPAEFTARYSPTPAQCAAAAQFAQSQGLTVTGLSPDRLLLHLSAPSSAVETAFGIHLSQFLDARGRLFHAPDAEPSVPTSVAPLIVGVVGLNDGAILRPHLRHSGSDPLAALDAALPLQIGSGPNNALQPTDIRTAYGLTGSGLTGSGQTLAVVELDGYASSDIAGYENAFGLPSAPLRNILVDGGSGPLGGGQAEVTLDIELQVALAPGIGQILVYEGPNSDQGVLDIYSRIAADNQAKQISTSWGLAEDQVGTTLLNAENVIFRRMAAQGQTLFAAAGDSGAYDDGTTLSVDDPASQPYVTGVGGTSLRPAGAGGPYQAETTWNSGGGGISAAWPLPLWQQGVVSAASLGSLGRRNVPDVALDADPNTGYAILLNGSWQVYGGTSCASPLWAAFTALVNQNRAAGGAGPLGFANPALYALGIQQGGAALGDFHDVADGSNNNAGKGGPYYPAVAGYDDATGWGSFNGATLLADLTPPPAPAALTATPGNATISLSWTASPRAASYTLYRATSAGGEGATPYLTGLTGTTYTDTGLTNGTTYYYVVTATAPGGQSAASNEVSAKPVAPTPPMLVNGASFVSQSVPTTMTAGLTSPVSVTIKNTGTTTWTAANFYSLGAENPHDNTTWTASNRIGLPASVAPGASVTFAFTVTAPALAGTYPFGWRMVQDGVQWFGDFTPVQSVNVTASTAALVNGASFVSQSVPSTMTAGQSYPVSVTYQNTGTTTWNSATLYRLGSQSPADNATWTPSNRVLLPSTVAPGQSVTFSFTVTAPASAGTYPFGWRMVQDGVQWFGDFTPVQSVNVTASAATPVNGASFISQSVPTTMTAGQSYPASVTVKNTGTTTWTAANFYSLGAENPHDNTTWTASNRIGLPASVAPGQSVTFAFTVTAPASAGTYPFGWRMVQDGVQWFGDFTPVQSVAVH